MSIGNKTTRKQEFMEQKRVGKASTAWKTLSTQASSAQESSKEFQVKLDDLHVVDNNEKVEVNQAIENEAKDGHGKSEAESRSVNLVSSSRTFQGNEVGGALESGSVPSENKVSISLKVGASLMRFIKGKWGSTQKKIEKGIGVKIIFPPSRNEDSIVIEGTSADSISRASERIHSIVDEVVNSPNLDYSHFVSLPLAIHPELVEKLVNFQMSILGSSNLLEDENLVSDLKGDTLDDEDESNVAVQVQVEDAKDDGNVSVKLKVEDDREHEVDINNIQRVSYAPKVPKPSKKELSEHSAVADLGIEKSIFIKPATFHLTVLMLKLWNKDRAAAAAEVLQSVASSVNEALDNRPVSIKLQGLKIMKGSLAQARVVYVPVEEIDSEGRLERACQVIINAFVEAGLVLERDAQTKLKLHATVMNARHRKRKQKARFADSFDARYIFKQYSSEEWDKVTADAALDPSGLVAIAICHAFALFVAVSVGANISGGHVNPAVTFGLAIGGQITIITGIFYWIAQLAGSIVACYLLKVVTGGLAIPTHSLSSGVGAVEGVVMETIITFALVYTVYATAADPKKGSLGTIAPIAIGFIVGANILAAGPFSGGSMNPARSFGPAVVSGDYHENWIYWVGPLIGGALAGLVYPNVFMHHDHTPLSTDY